MYMQWPLIMTILLLAMNIWMYMTDQKAGLTMTVFVIIYAMIVGLLYFYNRSLILADLIQFSTQYKGIQNTLLKELTVPYAIILEDGHILWKNDRFSEIVDGREKFIQKIIPELNKGIFPKDDETRNELEITYKERDYPGGAAQDFPGGLQRERADAADSERKRVFYRTLYERCDRTEFLHP